MEERENLVYFKVKFREKNIRRKQKVMVVSAVPLHILGKDLKSGTMGKF